MKMLNQLRTLSTSLSLIILALGFSAFGFVPLINKSGSTISVFSAENAYSLIGSSFSILVGAIFLVAAVSFRRVRSGSESLIQQIDVFWHQLDARFLATRLEVRRGKDRKKEL
jgi:hypothetical protein